MERVRNVQLKVRVEKILCTVTSVGIILELNIFRGRRVQIGFGSSGCLPLIIDSCVTVMVWLPYNSTVATLKLRTMFNYRCTEN